MGVPLLRLCVEGSPPQVAVRRDLGVPEDFWHALPVRMGAVPVRGPDGTVALMQMPLDRLLSGRLWLLQHCRSYGVGLQTDDEIKRRLGRAQTERSALRETLDGAFEKPEMRTSSEYTEPRALLRGLRPFQERDLAKLTSLMHGANFSVPGAGKTTVTYALYEAERTRGRVERMLVVAPLSAFEAWETEAVRCFDSPPKVCRFEDGIPWDAEVVLVNYHRLRAPYFDMLVSWALARPTHVVLDEAHRMKRGRQGEWGRACLQIAYVAERRDILTGTPAPQSSRDMEALFDFVWPGQARRILPAAALEANPGQGAMAALSAAIDPLFVRTTKSELGLRPPRLRAEIVPLCGLQAEIYDAMRNRYAGMFDLGRVDRAMLAQMGEVTMYLLEAATNPALLARRTADQPAASFVYPSLAIPPDSSLGALIGSYHRHEVPSKFVRLAQMVQRNHEQGRKTLVWSNFVGNLLALERVLAHYRPALVYGGVPSVAGPAPAGVRTREGELSRFRHDDTCTVLLANPAAMAEGVSLHETCHDAVYVDRTFNAGQYLQSLDRIHRLGLPDDTETRITFLVTERTIDERVDERVAAKALSLGEMLNDSDLAAMALPDDEDFGQPIEDLADLAALLGHLCDESDE